jgi:hypothetical protein
MAAGGSRSIWVVAETNADGSLAKSSSEVATLARTLAEPAGGDAAGIVVAADPGAAAKELAGYVSRVVAVAEPNAEGHAWAQVAAQRAAAILASESPAAVLTGAGPDGRDVAGTLAALLDRAVLVNATAVAWGGDGAAGADAPAVQMSVFGGKLTTTSTFSDGEWGIVTVRPNVVTAEKAASLGEVENRAPERGPDRGGEDHRRGRPWRRRRGGLQAGPGHRRCARWRRRGHEGGRRLGLDPVCPADRPDGQDREAAAVPGARHLRRDPAQGRDADRGHDHRRQPRPRRADRRVRRPRRRWRPLRGREGAARAAPRARLTTPER